MNQNQININLETLDNHINDYSFQLSKKEYNAIRQECNHYANIRSVSIEALKIIQNNRGWVSDDAILIISKILNIPVSDIEGVATFYNQIFRQPVGKHIIRYCDSIVCYITGCQELKITLEDTLSIKVGDTTKDKKFTLLPTCCLGRCDTAPVIMINNDIHSCVIPYNLIKLLSLYK